MQSRRWVLVMQGAIPGKCPGLALSYPLLLIPYCTDLPRGPHSTDREGAPDALTPYSHGRKVLTINLASLHRSTRGGIERDLAYHALPREIGERGIV